MLLTQNYPIIESLLFSAPVRSCPSALIVIACRIPPVKTHWRTSPFTFAPRWHLLTIWASNHLSWCNYPMQRIKALYEPKNALECRPPFSWPCGNGFRSCHAVQIPRIEENPLTFPARNIRCDGVKGEGVGMGVPPYPFHALKNVRPCFTRASCASNHPKIMNHGTTKGHPFESLLGKLSRVSLCFSDYWLSVNKMQGGHEAL